MIDITTAIVSSTDKTVTCEVTINAQRAGELQMDRIAYTHLMELLNVKVASTKHIGLPVRTPIASRTAPAATINS